MEDLCQRKQKKRKDAIDTDDLHKVEDFYRRGDISSTRPDARSARKTGQRYMTTRVRQMRPMDVQPSYRNKKRNCLREYCTNIDLKRETLSRYSASHRLQDICIKDRYEVTRLALCPKGRTGEYKKACLDRKCDECGTSTIPDRLQPLLPMDECHILHVGDCPIPAEWCGEDVPSEKNSLSTGLCARTCEGGQTF